MSVTEGEKWRRKFEEGVESDGWGQVLEAVDSYVALANALESSQNSFSYTTEERSTIAKLAICLRLRVRALKEGERHGISLPDMKLLKTVFENLSKGVIGPFPVSIAGYQAEEVAVAASSTENAGDEIKGGSLLPAPIVTPGNTYLSIYLSKIGLKDAPVYLDPFITVSVRDKTGAELEAIQDTPYASGREKMSVLFGVTAHIQEPINRLPEGSAIFFEFKHWKPKKKKISTRCYCFMEMDEIKSGTIALEIYKKPTDYTRHKLRLLSIKRLYLELNLTLLVG